MYTKSEYNADLRNWQKAVGNLTNDFEAVCKQLTYRNLIDTCSKLRDLATDGLIDYPDEEYVGDLVHLIKEFHGVDMTGRLKVKEEESPN